MWQKLEKFHASIYQRKVFHLFTWFTRILLAIGFIPPGIKKVLYHRFTSITIDHPIGFFFEALYRTGFYYQFIGIMQVSAAIMLLIPKTSTLGALLYFPIILNIFLIVTSMHFTGTPYIVFMMLLANVYLLCWDYEKMKRAVKAIL